MREYGQIQCGFWQSEDAQAFTDAGKLLAAYLLTGPHSNGIGCYRCPDGYVMEDLGWSSERVSQGFEELSRNRFAYRFKGVVCIPKFLAWNKVSNGNVAKARMAELNALPNGEAKGMAARAMLGNCGFLSESDVEHLETLIQTLPHTVPQTVCQPETNPNQPREEPTLYSSPASPATPPADLTAKRQERDQRLAQVTEDAITAFNASKLVKPNGGHLATVSAKVGRERRQRQVERCLRTARAICREDYSSDRITAEFWADYWTAVHEDDFHSGRQRGGRGHENWVPDFEFLTREATMLKVYDRAASENAA